MGRHHKSFYPVRQGHQFKASFHSLCLFASQGESPSVPKPGQGGHPQGLYGLIYLPSREMYASAQFPPSRALKCPQIGHYSPTPGNPNPKSEPEMPVMPPKKPYNRLKLPGGPIAHLQKNRGSTGFISLRSSSRITKPSSFGLGNPHISKVSFISQVKPRRAKRRKFPCLGHQ